MKIYFGSLALVESVVLYASFYAGAYLRFAGSFEAAHVGIGNLAPRAAVFTFAAMVALVSVGLYRSRQRVRPMEMLLRLGTAGVLAASADAIVYYLIPGVSTGRGAQALALGAGLIGLVVTRTVFYSVVGSDRFKRNVLIYGQGKTAEQLMRLCGALGHRSFRIAGYLGVLGDQADSACAPLLPRTAPLLQLARERQIDEIVVAMDNRRSGFPTRELLDCRLAGIRVSEVLTFAEREVGRIDLQALNTSWLIYGNGFRQSALHRSLKRVFDIAAGTLLLILALPLLAIAVAAILIESRGGGGVFLRQKRVGLNGAVFEMLKLRSMVADAEHGGRAQWTVVEDPRITRVGALLRRFRIDELPQILNILKGEMSFVGPRPERPEFVDELAKQIPFYGDRHCVKPGLTGWAQLCYPYGASVEDARQKLQYDLFYLKNHSPTFDLLILLQTLEVVLWNKARPTEDVLEQAGRDEPKHRAA